MIELTDSLDVDSHEVTRFLDLRDPGFFDYEYRRYRPEQSVFIQARREGQLVGTQALVPYPLRIAGEPTASGRSERTMVDRSLRGGGLFPQLMEACAAHGSDKGLQLIWGTTTAKTVFCRNGFSFFEEFYEHALFCVHPTAVARDLRVPQPRNVRVAKLAAVAPSLALRAAGRLRGRGDLAIEPRPRRSDDIDQLMDELQGDSPMVVLHHEPRFLDWLLDESGRDVARYHAYAGERLMGYAYVDRSSATTATLLDFGARDAASLHALVRSAAHDLGNAAFLHVRYNVRNPLLARQRPWLIAAGFVPVYRGGGFVVRPLAFRDPGFLDDVRRWYITEMWFQLYPQTRMA
jgi:GNAT superfamily N-acetyltransferase